MSRSVLSQILTLMVSYRKLGKRNKAKKKVPKRDGSIKDHLARGKKSHIIVAAEMYPLDCNKPITIQCVYAMSCLEICCVRQTWFETLKPFVRNCSKHTTFKCISAIKQSRLKLLE